MTENDERLHDIAKTKGLRLENITCERDGYGWGAWVGEFELGCKVGNGRTWAEAVEDLLDMLEYK